MIGARSDRIPEPANSYLTFGGMQPGACISAPPDLPVNNHRPEGSASRQPRVAGQLGLPGVSN